MSSPLYPAKIAETSGATAPSAAESPRRRDELGVDGCFALEQRSDWVAPPDEGDDGLAAAAIGLMLLSEG
ncbi:MAG: hypothetical protein KC486_24205 [Myxococcales bacterium]|nr:hypothetical protein [Myxococcales bacterium]